MCRIPPSIAHFAVAALGPRVELAPAPTDGPAEVNAAWRVEWAATGPCVRPLAFNAWRLGGDTPDAGALLVDPYASGLHGYYAAVGAQRAFECTVAATPAPSVGAVPAPAAP